MQKMPSQDLKQKETSNRSDVAIFSGKCYMLAGLMERGNVPKDLLAEVLASMWRQSEAILGIH